MRINGLLVDVEQGFDVMQGSKVIDHFSTYEAACACAAKKRGRYVRYWGVKKS